LFVLKHDKEATQASIIKLSAVNISGFVDLGLQYRPNLSF